MRLLKSSLSSRIIGAIFVILMLQLANVGYLTYRQLNDLFHAQVETENHVAVSSMAFLLTHIGEDERAPVDETRSAMAMDETRGAMPMTMGETGGAASMPMEIAHGAASALTEEPPGATSAPIDEAHGDRHIMTEIGPDVTVDDLRAVVDAIQQISEMEASILRLDPISGEFIRQVTTFRDDNGLRSEGTVLESGAVPEGLLAGTSVYTPEVMNGVEYLAHYQPIFGADGNVSGAMGVARDSATFRAAQIAATNMRQKVVISVVALLLVLFVGYAILRRMLAPFGRIAAAIATMSEGNFAEDIPYSDREDEVGKIAGSLSILQVSMQKAEDLKVAETKHIAEHAEKQREQAVVVEALRTGLSRLSDLDLAARIETSDAAPFPADYDGLRVSFNHLVDQLSDTISMIRDVAEEVTGDAREMASSSTDLSSRTESQAATLQQSAAALEELSQSVQSTAENAADAEATTNENRAAAKEAGDIVDNAISAMEAIEASSQKITQIISVIDDIAFQTNLLALNAGVEAARAGEAGRGFAVVASEVRALAQHSSASAQEIKTLIAASSEQVESGSKLVRATGKSLGDIISQVDRVAGLVSDIAISAKDQSVGVSEINAGVRDLDAATQRNAAMAEEASAASEGLTSAADRLASHLGRFQMAKTSGSANWAAAAAARQNVAIRASIPAKPKLAQTGNSGVAQMDVFRDF